MKFYIESKTHGRHAVLIDDEDAAKKYHGEFASYNEAALCK